MVLMPRPSDAPADPELAPVAGAPGYHVARDGVVYGKRGKALSPCATPRGSLKVVLYVNSAKLGREVHRLVAAAFVPNPKGLPHVIHLDGDRRNNRASNLVWAGHGERARRAARAAAACPPVLPGHACDAIEQEDECSVCLESRAVTLFGPCLHVCCCAACAAALRKPLCPVCRGPVAAQWPLH